MAFLRAITLALACGICTVESIQRHIRTGYAVHDSIINNQLEELQTLLADGASANTEDEGTGASPLYAASSHGRLEHAKLLIEKGANVNHLTHDKTTSLIAAAFNGHLEIVKLLVENGASLDAVNDQGYNPMEAAVTGDQEAVVEYLATLGAERTEHGKQMAEELEKVKQYRAERKERVDSGLLEHDHPELHDYHMEEEHQDVFHDPSLYDHDHDDL